LKSQHRARRLAIQGLCCVDAGDGGKQELVEQFLKDSREPPAVIEAAMELIKESRKDVDNCDEILGRNAHRWELGRLALVDRNILRLAAFELRKNTEPCGVIISEALKLAREFSTSESPRFINGVLDAVRKELVDGQDKTEKNNT